MKLTRYSVDFLKSVNFIGHLTKEFSGHIGRDFCIFVDEFVRKGWGRIEKLNPVA